MESLLYRSDINEVRQRFSAWWNGEDIGRPVVLITTPSPKPAANDQTSFTAEPKAPEGCCPQYTVKSLEYRVERADHLRARNMCLGEEVPVVSPCLGPNCLALYLGCTTVEGPDTVWFEPCIDDPDRARFMYDPDNPYWDFQLRLIKALLQRGRGKYLVAFPDLIEGLDTLSAMRGTERLLTDLIDRPEWVHRSLVSITDLYIKYYDIIYDLIKDETGGSCFWTWAPGKMAKFQCDFSAMISPSMFHDFMTPVLTRLSGHVTHCIYHWDGPGALCHLDELLSIPGIDVIQWTPGEGLEHPAHKRWWPLYHKILEQGKRVFISYGVDAESLSQIKREFGPKLKRFMLAVWTYTVEDAERILDLAMVD